MEIKELMETGDYRYALESTLNDMSHDVQEAISILRDAEDCEDLSDVLKDVRNARLTLEVMADKLK